MNSVLKAACLAASVAWMLGRPLLASTPIVVGMVLDVQGPVTVSENGSTTKLQLLAKLASQSRIRLAADSKASLTIYATRSVYRLTGPALVETTKDGLSLLQGNPPEVRFVGEKLTVAAHANSFIAGAYRMRNMGLSSKIVLNFPESGSVLLDTRPRFTWQAAEPAAYTLTLEGDAGNLIYSTTVNATAWSLPEGIQLEYGRSYRWEIHYVSPKSGKIRSASDRFTVATRAEVEQVAELKPAEDDPIEDWVFYAASLQQRQMRSEAREIWKRIAAERPDLEAAKEFSRWPRER